MEVNLSERSLRTNPGDTVETSVEIYNNGAGPDTYTVNLEGLAPSWYELSTVSASLFPGDSSSSALSILPPRNSSSMARTYSFQVVVSSQLAPAGVARQSGYLTLEPFHSFGAELTLVTERKNSSSYLLKLRNDSNIPLTAQLSGRDPRSSLVFRFDQAELTIGPGEIQEIGLTVAPRRRPLLGSPKERNFLVKATIPLPGAVPALMLGAANIYPWIPLWVFWLFLLVIAIVAVVAGVVVVAESYQ